MKRVKRETSWQVLTDMYFQEALVYKESPVLQWNFKAFTTLESQILTNTSAQNIFHFDSALAI